MEMHTFMMWFFGLMAGIGIGGWMSKSEYKSFKPMKKRLFELGELIYSNDGEGKPMWKDGSEFK